jgi:four helix bundle protein
VNFYFMARGSLTETQSHLEYGKRVGYLAASVSQDLSDQLETIHSDLNKVISTLRKSGR